MMNIVILSRSPQLYSTQSLFKAGLRRRHFVRVIDYMECSLVIEQERSQIIYRGEQLKDIDAIIPRIGASASFYGAAVVRQFEINGVVSTASSTGLVLSRNKLHAYQLLCANGIGMPRTVFSNPSQRAAELIQSAGGAPVVIKLLKGTHGLGVILAQDFNTAESVIEAFNQVKERILIQEYIAESKGSDIRALVVNNKIAAAMKREAQPGEFRSNLHRGASATSIRLTPAETEIALKATKLLGLRVAGVDLLQSRRGPLILEVNPSPGLEGIETSTRINVAEKIIKSLEKAVNKDARTF